MLERKWAPPTPYDRTASCAAPWARAGFANAGSQRCQRCVRPSRPVLWSLVVSTSHWSLFYLGKMARRSLTMAVDSSGWRNGPSGWTW
jgi:hypothetical protein